jgi:N-acetylmuramoyl-L-alanine amidase
MDRKSWETMKLTIYGEARGQLFDGQLAVGFVIANRARRGGWWGNTIIAVCLKPLQFSCWNKTDRNLAAIQRAHDGMPRVREAGAAAALVLSGFVEDITKGSTHYHTVAKPIWAKVWPPVWTRSMTPTVTIGDHTFYLEE